MLKRGSGAGDVFGYAIDIAGTETTHSCTTVPVVSGCYYLTVTWDGANGRCFVHGIQETTAAKTVTMGNNGTPVTIGSYNSGASSFLNGRIDEVRIYNRALTATEVYNLYKGSKASVVNKTKTNRLTNGLVGYWTFDGKDIYSTTAIDRSGSGNNGTLTNGPVPTIGKIGQALNFDGSDDYVSLSDFADSSANITISAWVRPRTFDNVWPFISTIVGKELAGNNSYTLRAGDSAIANIRLQWAIIQSNSTAVKLDANITVGLLSTSTWSHVTATYNTSGRQEIYINGVLNASQSTADGTLKDSTTAIEIGRSFAASARIWDGQIDDVRIYNRALSAEEIYQLYNMGR